MLKIKPQDRIQIGVGDRTPVYTVLNIDNDNVTLESECVERTASYAALNKLYGERFLTVLPRKAYIDEIARARVPALADSTA